MSDWAKAAVGMALPFLGTVLGAGTVLLLKREMGARLQKLLLGFAAGVMIAASVWSLLIPAIEMSEEAGGAAWIPAVVGFLLGMGFLLVLDSVIPHLHLNAERPEGRPSSLGKARMLVLAVTLHNLPEGMAVGVVLAGMLEGSTVITGAGALALAIGIAVQNFPEGAVISAPRQMVLNTDPTSTMPSTFFRATARRYRRASSRSPPHHPRKCTSRRAGIPIPE